MPQPRSSRFDREQRTSHTPIRRNDLLTAAGQVIQRDVPTLPGGMVTADRTSTSTHLVRDVEFLRDSLTPEAQNALQRDLADAFLQSWAGIRYQDTEMVSGHHYSEATWTGTRVGVLVDGDGFITLGD
jgi:hypothetical protein